MYNQDPHPKRKSHPYNMMFSEDAGRKWCSSPAVKISVVGALTSGRARRYGAQDQTIRSMLELTSKREHTD